MRGVFGNPDVVASEIGGQYRPGRDKIVPPPKFAAVCRVLWPVNTAAHIAAIAGKDERTGKRWLAGEFEAPAVVYAAIFQEMLKRE
jgi:hypothetical protein